MKIASIDIGTNTVLLLVANVNGSGEISTLAYEQRVPRLGKGVDVRKNLQPDSMHRVVEVLREYREIISQHHPDAVVVCGTSAVRDAVNRDEFAHLIARNTGLSLEILSGDDEALWTYRGAISGMPGIRRSTVIDIGGGSTEITIGEGQRIERKVSLDIGSVRLTERLFRHDPPTPREVQGAIDLVQGELSKVVGFEFAGRTLVGVAGTATTLAILAQGVREFNIRAVTNVRLTLDTVRELVEKLRQMNSSAILQLSSVMEGRADVITAGALILREVLIRFGFDEMIVSERGVRYGIVLREWEKTIRKN